MLKKVKKFAKSDLDIIAASDLEEAAEKIVKVVEGKLGRMSILINKTTKVICQGFTGSQGNFSF